MISAVEVHDSPLARVADFFQNPDGHSQLCLPPLNLRGWLAVRKRLDFCNRPDGTAGTRRGVEAVAPIRIILEMDSYTVSNGTERIEHRCIRIAASGMAGGLVCIGFR